MDLPKYETRSFPLTEVPFFYDNAEIKNVIAYRTTSWNVSGVEFHAYVALILRRMVIVFDLTRVDNQEFVQITGKIIKCTSEEFEGTLYKQSFVKFVPKHDVKFGNVRSFLIGIWTRVKYDYDPARTGDEDDFGKEIEHGNCHTFVNSVVKFSTGESRADLRLVQLDSFSPVRASIGCALYSHSEALFGHGRDALRDLLLSRKFIIGYVVKKDGSSPLVVIWDGADVFVRLQVQTFEIARAVLEEFLMSFSLQPSGFPPEADPAQGRPPDRPPSPSPPVQEVHSFRRRRPILEVRDTTTSMHFQSPATISRPRPSLRDEVRLETGFTGRRFPDTTHEATSTAFVKNRSSLEFVMAKASFLIQKMSDTANRIQVFIASVAETIEHNCLVIIDTANRIQVFIASVAETIEHKCLVIIEKIAGLFLNSSKSKVVALWVIRGLKTVLHVAAITFLFEPALTFAFQTGIGAASSLFTSVAGASVVMPAILESFLSVAYYPVKAAISRLGAKIVSLFGYLPTISFTRAGSAGRDVIGEAIRRGGREGVKAFRYIV